MFCSKFPSFQPHKPNPPDARRVVVQAMKIDSISVASNFIDGGKEKDSVFGEQPLTIRFSGVYASFCSSPRGCEAKFSESIDPLTNRMRSGVGRVLRWKIETSSPMVRLSMVSLILLIHVLPVPRLVLHLLEHKSIIVVCYQKLCSSLVEVVNLLPEVVLLPKRLWLVPPFLTTKMLRC